MTKEAVNFRLTMLAVIAVAIVHVHGANVHRDQANDESEASTTANPLPPGKCVVDSQCPTVHYCYIIEGRPVGDCRLTWWIIFIGVIVGVICIPWFIIVFSIAIAVVVCVGMVVGKIIVEIFYCVIYAFHFLGKEMAKSCGCHCAWCRKSGSKEPLSRSSSSSSSSLQSWYV